MLPKQCNGEWLISFRQPQLSQLVQRAISTRPENHLQSEAYVRSTFQWTTGVLVNTFILLVSNLHAKFSDMAPQYALVPSDLAGKAQSQVKQEQKATSPGISDLIGFTVLLSLHRDAFILLLCKSVRMFGFGFLSVMVNISTSFSYSSVLSTIMFALHHRGAKKSQ